MRKNIFGLLLLITCLPSFSSSGLFFNVSQTGTPASAQITLCLNGKGKTASCQIYNVSALTLSILTTIPNHTYQFAGVKVNTPGYSLSNCSLNDNGYCLFSVSNSKAATLLLTPQTCQADVISFSPNNTAVNNPIGSTVTTPQQFTINMMICDSQGKPLIPSSNNPLHIDVYGAPTGTISPTSITTNKRTVTFTYNGQPFPNNISINAWIKDSTNNGAAIGVTQVLKQNTPSSCTYGSKSYNIPLVQTLPSSLQAMADVGYSASSPLSSLTPYIIDTGSLGVLVPSVELPQSANVIGPGTPGVKYYDSSGDTYSGFYYLAPIRVQTTNGIVQTIPIMVLGINEAYCTGPLTNSCYSTPPSPNIHYLGVGFNRNSTYSDDLFNSPTANAFLHLTNAQNGTNLSPGYYLTPNDGTTETGFTLGITTNKQYNVINLSPNPNVPGDFNAQAGCYSFPYLPPPNNFCGTALLDSGIDSMFTDLLETLRPPGTQNVKGQVPVGITMSILMGTANKPAMQYQFDTVDGNPPSDSPTPTVVQWIDKNPVFVNTGRRPLYVFDYFYNGQCGQVGFKPLS